MVDTHFDLTRDTLASRLDTDTGTAELCSLTAVPAGAWSSLCARAIEPNAFILPVGARGDA